MLTSESPLSPGAGTHMARVIDFVWPSVAAQPDTPASPLIASAAQHYLVATVLATFPKHRRIPEPTIEDRHDSTPVLLRTGDRLHRRQCTHRDISLADIAGAVHVTRAPCNTCSVNTERLHAHRIRATGSARPRPSRPCARRPSYHLRCAGRPAVGFAHLGRFAIYYRMNNTAAVLTRPCATSDCLRGRLFAPQFLSSLRSDCDGWILGLSGLVGDCRGVMGAVVSFGVRVGIPAFALVPGLAVCRPGAGGRRRRSSSGSPNASSPPGGASIGGPSIGPGHQGLPARAASSATPLRPEKVRAPGGSNRTAGDVDSGGADAGHLEGGEKPPAHRVAPTGLAASSQSGDAARSGESRTAGMIRRIRWAFHGQSPSQAQFPGQEYSPSGVLRSGGAVAAATARPAGIVSGVLSLLSASARRKTVPARRRLPWSS